MRRSYAARHAPPSADEPRVEGWNRKVDWPLTALALVFLVAYAWSVLDRSISPAGQDALEVLLTGMTWWSSARLPRADRAGPPPRPLRAAHLPDLAVLLLPMFRPLRILRLITVISVLHRQLRDDVRGRVLVYVAGSVTLVGFVAALAVLDAERDAPNASITTVGYGDRYPVTVEGRIVAGR